MIILHILALFACILAALGCALLCWRALHVAPRLTLGCLFPAGSLVLCAAFLTASLVLAVHW